MEAGERWMLNDVAGKPIRAWDSRALPAPHRPTTSCAGPRACTSRTAPARSAWPCARSTARAGRRGEPPRPRLPGVRRRGNRDQRRLRLQGQPLREPARPASRCTSQPTDWLLNPAAERRQLHEPHDLRRAQPRRRPSTTPDGSVYRADLQRGQPARQGRRELRGAAPRRSFVTNIDYNAKGQRTLIAYANGAETTYEYDPLTFRLTQLKTTRAGPDATALALFPIRRSCRTCATPTTPSGNITRIEDAALQTVFYGNQQVDRSGDYTYDALYRLIEAAGASTSARRRSTFARPTRTTATTRSSGMRRTERPAGAAQLHRALRVRRGRQPRDCPPRRGRRQLDAQLRVRRDQPARDRPARATA